MGEHRVRGPGGRGRPGRGSAVGHRPVLPRRARRDQGEAMARERRQSGTPFEQPWPLTRWPDVPTTFLLCRQDRFFPPRFMRRVVQDRLGIAVDEIDAGHYVLLSRPRELARRLESYASDDERG
ncbi:alpha/beta hydrolase [Oerskovia sp. M15]